MKFRGFGPPPTFYFLWILPRNIFSRLCGYFGDLFLPIILLKVLIKLYCRYYGVNLAESEKNISEFRTFNEFFTRRLIKDARQIDQGVNTLISPVDGFIGEFGNINNGNLIQAKGIDYRLEDLLEDQKRSLLYNGGTFITIYLAPQNYHRIHSFYKGEVNEFSYVAGDLWPVNVIGINYVKGLFARNERLTTYINTDRGECALVKVGATVVGRIKVNYHSQVSNLSRAQSKNFFLEKPFKLEKGQEIGVFELGSTVICLFPPKQIKLNNLKLGQIVYYGESIGKMS